MRTISSVNRIPHVSHEHASPRFMLLYRDARWNPKRYHLSDTWAFQWVWVGLHRCGKGCVSLGGVALGCVALADKVALATKTPWLGLGSVDVGGFFAVLFAAVVVDSASYSFAFAGIDLDALCYVLWIHKSLSCH